MSIKVGVVLSRNPDLLHAAVGAEEAVMMSIEAGRYYGVNAVGARIWELLETPQTIQQLCTQICAEFDVDAQTCQTAILNFARDLIENGVVHASAT